jgi:hypothetical protein
MGAAPALLAGQPVDGALDPAGDESLADFDPVAALPPVSLQRVNQRAFDGFGLPQLLAVGLPLLR